MLLQCYAIRYNAFKAIRELYCDVLQKKIASMTASVQDPVSEDDGSHQRTKYAMPSVVFGEALLGSPADFMMVGCLLPNRHWSLQMHKSHSTERSNCDNVEYFQSIA